MKLDSRIRPSIISIITGIVLVSIKGSTAFLTGSLAIMADAYHSLSDLIISISVLASILLHHIQERKGGPPADSASPDAGSGHAGTPVKKVKGTRPVPSRQRAMPGYWIESLATFLALLLILYMAYKIVSKVMVGPPDRIHNIAFGLFSVTACVGIAYFVSRFKTMLGRETDSPALVADGYRSLMDMFTSIAVLLSIMGQWIWIEIESVVAVVIAVMIVFTGINLFISSFVSFTRKS